MNRTYYYRPSPTKSTRLAKKKKHLLRLIILPLLIGGAFYLHEAAFGGISHAKATARTAATQAATGVNKATAATPSTSTTDPSAALIADWKGIMDSRSGSVDVAIYDSNTGKTVHYTNSNGTFAAASVVKLSILENVVAIDQAKGTQLSSDQLAEAAPMIEESDNDSATNLWNSVGGSAAMQAFFNKVGATSTTTDVANHWGLTQTTALDQVKIANAFAYPNGPLSTSSETIVDNLLDQVEDDQLWGISGGLPDDVSFELKDGWLPDNETADQYADTDDWTVNSVGHVHGSGADYTIAILTNGDPDEQYGITTAEDLSAVAWSHLS